MKNNIKKAPVNYRVDRYIFSAFYADFCLCPKSVIITTLKVKIVGKVRSLGSKENIKEMKIGDSV